MTYMLDTNACLDFLIGRNARVAARMAQAFGGLGVSAISVAELQVGNRTSADPAGDARQLDVFLRNLDIAPFDSRAAVTYGAIMRSVGVGRLTFDRLIAAHAITLGWTLVTNNEADFADVPGLAVENWSR